MTESFDPQALYDAINEQRLARGLTWNDVSKELMVSASTIKGMTKRTYGIELDGVIGMCRWVGRSVESFAGDNSVAAAPVKATKLGYFNRFDAKALHAAVSAERERRGMTWAQVAKEIWPARSGSSRLLQDMANGGRGEVFTILAVTRWVGRPIESFMYESVL